jgi:hypothetical protein
LLPPVTPVVTAVAQPQRSERAMHDDDLTWWHHQDELMQQLEEQQRIEACNKAIDELKENDDAE